MDAIAAHRLQADDLDRGWVLLLLGRTICPACQVAAAGAEALAAAWPDLCVRAVSLDAPEDWASRERILWPRGIHVSRATVPVAVLLHDGAVIATRHGAIPAHAMGEWLAPHLGPADLPRQITPREQVVLDRTAARRAQHSAVAYRD